MYRLGVVSFLNAKPLIAGGEIGVDVQVVLDVPARLPALLADKAVDAALIPTVDILHGAAEYSVLSDACIGCDGETMTVRVFSQVPPDRITRLHVDGDSHTSVALARVLWQELYRRELELIPIEARHDDLQAHEAVLLIGDKVIDPRRTGFAFETDLGGAWRHLTGLPFMFAAWACPREQAPSLRPLAQRLTRLRDLGVAQAASLAHDHGPSLGWPVALAERYLTRCLRFTIDERMRAGVERFAQLGRAHGVLAVDAALSWEELAADAPATSPEGA